MFLPVIVAYNVCNGCLKMSRQSAAGVACLQCPFCHANPIGDSFM